MQCGGLPPSEYKLWVFWEDVRRGAYDPKERLRECDASGVAAEVLFPSPRLQNAVMQNRDAELQLACVRAYNDWLSEFCSHDPARFVGVPMLPGVGLDSALAELDAHAAPASACAARCSPSIRTAASRSRGKTTRCSRAARRPASRCTCTSACPGRPAGTPALAPLVRGRLHGRVPLLRSARAHRPS